MPTETLTQSLVKHIGLIAGYGSFPLELTKYMRAAGLTVHVIATKEETDASIESLADSVVWLHVGQLGAAIRELRSANVEQVVFAGKVGKLHLFRNFKPDWLAIKTLAKLPDLRDDSLMLGIVSTFEEGGLQVISQLKYAGFMLAMQGHLFGPKPNKQALADAQFGMRQAKGIAALDIGQTVVIQKKAVLAVEAIEGTDAAIKRGGELGNGKAVVIKVAKPNQDPRFDVPAIGADTLHSMYKSGCKHLVIEANQTLLLQQSELAKLAKKYAISVQAMII
ncbi:MAG: UDP-2,3-diacylglucosamine diphosphatase LpxI [Mariprofundales bacterium]